MAKDDSVKIEAPANQKEKTPETPQEPKAQRASLALDITQKKSEEFLHAEQLKSEDYKEKPNAPDFNKIDLNESAEKQRTALTSLAGTSIFELVPVMLHSGVDFESIRNLSVFGGKFETTVTKKPESLNEKNLEDSPEAFKKIQEILASKADGKDSVATVWKNEWERLAAKGKEAYAIMAPVLNGKDPKKAVDAAPVPAEEPGFFDKHPYAKYAATGLGLIIGGYIVKESWDWVTSKFSKKEEQKPAEGFFGKFLDSLKYTAMLTGAGWGLGKILKFDAVRSVLKKMGIDDSRVVKAIRYLSDGEFKKAAEVLYEGDHDDQENLQICKNINEKIQGANVTPKAIAEIADMKFNEWAPGGVIDQILQSGTELVTGALTAKIKGALKDIPILGALVEKDPELVKQLEGIKKYFALPENQEKIRQINPGSTMTVRDVLKQLSGIKGAEAGKASTQTVAEVAAVGAVGQTAKEKETKENATIAENHSTIAGSLSAGNEIPAKSSGLLKNDLEKCGDILNKADEAGNSWWNREKECAHEFFLGTPDAQADEADLIKLMDGMGVNEKKELQEIRSVQGTLSEFLKAHKGKKLSEEDKQQMAQLLNEFYDKYEWIKKHLDQTHQTGVAEQEKRIQDARNNPWYKDPKRALAGTELVLNTFFGLPFSVARQIVPDQNEKNGTVTTVVGGAGLLMAGYGAVSTGGGIFKRGEAALHGAMAPVRLVLKNAPLVPVRALELADFYKTTGFITEVREGKKTVEEGIEAYNEYLSRYQSRWDGTKIEKNTVFSLNTKDRLKKIFRKSQISKDYGEYLEDQLKTLQELKNNKCTTWAEGVSKKIVSPASSILKEKLPEFLKTEENLVTQKMKEIEADEKRRVDPKVPLQNEEIRRLAIEDLQKAGKLTTATEMGKTLKETLDQGSVEKLDTKDKIERLSNASKETDLYMEKAILEVKKMKADGKPQAEIEEFEKQVTEHMKGVREQFNATFEEIQKVQKSMTKDEAKDFEILVKERLAHANGIRGVMREVKGRGVYALVFGVANVVWDIYKVTEEEKEAHVQREAAAIAKEIGLDTFQVVADILSPFGVSDWYTAIEGKEFFTGKDAGVTQRVVSVAFGTYNLVSDTLAAIGGVATAEVGGAGGGAIYAGEKAIETPLRAAGKSAEIIAAAKAILPRIMTLAKESGGFGELLKILKSASTLKMLEGLKTAKKVSGAAVKGIMVYDVGRAAYAGYEIVFDMKNQPEHQISFEAAPEKKAD